MIRELKELELKLKQILYGCVEHVQATKAALYLPVSQDLTDKSFEIATSYQFNDPQRRVVTANDDLVDLLAVKRAPFFVNGIGTDQRFAEMLFRQSTDRLLAAPIFSRGRLIGFIDMRDKAGKKVFEREDLSASSAIVDQVLSLLGEKALFGLASFKVAEEPIGRTEIQHPAEEMATPAAMPAFRPQMPIPPLQPVARPRPGIGTGPASNEALRAISAARELVSKTPTRVPRKRSADRDLEIFRLVLPAALGVPGAAMACLTVVEGPKVSHALFANATVTDEAVQVVMTHLQRLLRRPPQGMTTPEPAYPFGTSGTPIDASTITAVQSAPLDTRALDGIALTIAFQDAEDADAQRRLQTFLQQMEPSIWSAALVTADLVDREMIAERLIEPDFQKYPELVDHSRQVASLVRRFALSLEISPLQVETIRIAALVHDVGLRLIDYHDLYRNPDLTPEQARVIAEHPIVGAAIVGPLLGADVANAVLRHHERVDGKGYPSRLAGNQVPMSSRIIQIADAWIAMTSATSYQPAVLFEQAIARLREGAGTQFDEQLVPRFITSLSQVVPA